MLKTDMVLRNFRHVDFSCLYLTWVTRNCQLTLNVGFIHALGCIGVVHVPIAQSLLVPKLAWYSLCMTFATKKLICIRTLNGRKVHRS